MQRHAWETDDENESHHSHEWEKDTCDGDWRNDPIDVINGNVDDADSAFGEQEYEDEDDGGTDVSAGQAFVDFRVVLLLSRTLSAKQFCIAMYYAGNCGIAEAARLGLHPDSQSGNFSAKVKSVLPEYADVKRRALYKFRAPSYSKDTLGRDSHEFTMALPHQVLVQHAQDNPDLEDQLQDAISENRLPPAYFENPVVRKLRAFGHQVLPLGIFIDGLPYSLIDSIVGVWLICLVTRKRFLLGVIRKKLCCHCGCRGWCILERVFCVSLEYAMPCTAAKPQ